MDEVVFGTFHQLSTWKDWTNIITSCSSKYAPDWKVPTVPEIGLLQPLPIKNLSLKIYYLAQVLLSDDNFVLNFENMIVILTQHQNIKTFKAKYDSK